MSLPPVTNPTLEAFLAPENFIFATTHWVLVLRPKQATLGATVLISKSSATRVTDLTQAEVSDLHNAWQKLAAMYDATLQPDKMNHLALMMVDPNPHFHVLPRYAAPRAFDGAFFNDAAWPRVPDTKEADIGLSQNQQQKLVQLLRDAVPQTQQ